MLTKELVLDLWSQTYNTEGKPDWSHILPYYDNNIYFRYSIQEIRGIEEFTAMTERLVTGIRLTLVCPKNYIMRSWRYLLPRMIYSIHLLLKQLLKEMNLNFTK